MRLLIVAAILITGSRLGAVEPKTDFSVAASIPTGTPIADVITLLGKPASTIYSPTGNRMVIWMRMKSNFWTGRFQSNTATLLFDADGKLIRIASESALESR